MIMCLMINKRVMTGDMGDGDWRVSDSRTDCIVTIAKKT
jgi:hypothetical protein